MQGVYWRNKRNTMCAKRISSKDILELRPSLESVLEKNDILWIDGFKSNGWETIAEPFEDFKDKKNSNIENLVELPSFLRIGRLLLEEDNKNKKNYSEVSSYLKKKSYPVLLNFRNAPAVLLKSVANSSNLLDIIQGSLINLMQCLDPSVIKITVVDLENFGSKFQFLNHSIPNPRVITESRDLKDLIAEIPEELKQRNQTRGISYKYLYDYNKKNRDSSQPYHFIFIGSYESDLDDESKLSLKKIIANSNATKAGIYFIINTATQKGFEDLVSVDKNIPYLIEERNDETSRFELVDPLCLDTSTSGRQSCFEIEVETDKQEIISKMAESCLQHMQKRAPEPVRFDLPNPENWDNICWKLSSVSGIDIPIGKSRGNQINLRLGTPDPVYNSLIGGAVGTGKTILLHGIIIQTMIHYSPSEIRLSLLDYKDGTEFNIYKSIPHLHALSVGSGTKFGVDLLKDFQSELTNRAKLFKEVNASNLQSYREITGNQMPRHLIVIDEFQVLMNSGPNDVAKNALEDLIRRGRSYGFTFILSSQSLKDGSLTPATKNNLGLRICLRVSESDCADFLSVTNTLPTLFRDAGQAVYNNQEGAPNGNNEFRCAFYKNSEIASFVKFISDFKTESPQKPYIYDDGIELSNKDLIAYHKEGSIIIGIEEGIPSTPHYIDFNENKGAVIISGTGINKMTLTENILTQCKQSGYEVIKYDSQTILSGGIDKIKLNDQPINNVLVIVNINAKDSSNYDYRESLEKLLNEDKVKYIIMSDHPSDIINYKDRADMVLCLDQRSYSSIAYGNKQISENTISIVNQYNQDGVLVKIPK